MARPKDYTITLTDAEREAFESIAKNYRYSQRERNRAKILLLSEQGRTDPQIAKEVGCCAMTVRNTRLRFCSPASPEPVAAKQFVKRARQANRPRRALDGEKEARLIALACSTPPEEAKRWTLQLLHDRLIEMQIVEKIGKETIRRTLKKTNSSPG